MLEEYIESLSVKGFTDDTRHVRREHLSLFERWAMERGLTEPVEVTRPVLERYQWYLFHYRKKDGCPLSFASQHSRLSPLRMWFRWMTRQNYLLHSPVSEIELPRLPKLLPRVLTASEAELILHQPNVADPVGIRDRAMLEMFYSTGMRRTELLRLRFYDVDREAGIMTIREGKGKKARVISVGERAVAWLDKYLDQARPGLWPSRTTALFFLPCRVNHLAPTVSAAWSAITWKRPESASTEPAISSAYDGHADARRRHGHPLHPADARPCAA